MAIEIVSFPVKNGDLQNGYVSLPEGNDWLTFVPFKAGKSIHLGYI